MLLVLALLVVLLVSLLVLWQVGERDILWYLWILRLVSLCCEHLCVVGGIKLLNLDIFSLIWGFGLNFFIELDHIRLGSDVNSWQALILCLVTTRDKLELIWSIVIQNVHSLNLRSSQMRDVHTERWLHAVHLILLFKIACEVRNSQKLRPLCCRSSEKHLWRLVWRHGIISNLRTWSIASCLRTRIYFSLLAEQWIVSLYRSIDCWLYNVVHYHSSNCICCGSFENLLVHCSVATGTWRHVNFVFCNYKLLLAPRSTYRIALATK